MFKNKQNEAFRNKNLCFQKSLSSMKSHLFSKPYRITAREKSDYILYARSLITQLLQQLQLNVLTIDFFKKQQKQIFAILKKCDSIQRSEAVYKLWGIYWQMKIEIQTQFYPQFEDAIKFWAKQSFIEQKLINCVQHDRIDISITYVYNNLSSASEQTIKNIKIIAQNIYKLSRKLQKKMLKKQYASLLKIIQFWRGKNFFRCQEKKRTQISHVCKIRMITKSDSSSSLVSEPSQSYLKKVAMFQEQNKAELLEKLISIGHHNKSKRLSTRYSGRKSIIIQNPQKRVSSSWGKNQSATKFNSGQMFGFTPSNNNLQPSTVKQSQLSIPQSQNHGSNLLITKSDHKIFAYQKQTKPNSFYVFSVINNKLRLTTVSQIDLTQIGSHYNLCLKLQGYFNQLVSFIIPKQQDSQKIICQQKLQLLKFTQISKISIWYKIEKVQSQIPNTDQLSWFFHKKNGVEQKKVSGFIKINNSNIFAILTEKNILELYDCRMEKIIMRRIIPFQLHSRLFLNNLNSIVEKQDDKNEQRITSSILIQKSVLRKEKKTKIFNIKEKYESSLLMQYITKKKVRNFNKKDSQTLDITRTPCHKFEILKFQKNQCEEITLTSLGLFGTNKFLMKIAQPNFQANQPSLNQLKTKFCGLYGSQKQKYMITRLSRRMNQSIFTKITLQFKFIRFSIKHGYIIFNICIFYNKQCPLIILESYLPSNQRYYQFNISKQIITDYFKKNRLIDRSYGELKYSLHIFCNNIQCKIQEKNKQIYKFGIEINKHKFQGSELLFRRCFTDQNNCLERIQTFSMRQLTSLNQQKILFKREVFDLSAKLRNYAFQDHILPTSSLFVHYTYLYLELLTSLKKYANSLPKSAKNLLYPCIKKQYNQIQRMKFGRKILTFRGTQKNNLQILQHEIRNPEAISLQLTEEFLSNDPLVNLLTGNNLLKYLARSFRNKGQKSIMLTQKLL